MNEQFAVQNVKCGGCVSAIENGLSELAGVSEVSATTDGQVSVSGNTLDRAELSEKLAALGYPEA